MDKNIKYRVSIHLDSANSSEIFDDLDSAIQHYKVSVRRLHITQFHFEVNVDKIGKLASGGYKNIVRVLSAKITSGVIPSFDIYSDNFDEDTANELDKYHKVHYILFFREHEKVYNEMKEEIDSWESIPELKSRQ